MLVGGIMLALLAGGAGEFRDFHPANVSRAVWWSLLYLIVAGSIIGFTAYVWLIHHESPTKVGTYAYVNPVVAVLLGTLFAGETMTTMQLLGLAIILVSVLLINLAKYRKAGTGLTGAQKAVSGTV